MRNLTIALVAVAAVALLAGSANAAVIVYEGFNYPAGNIDGTQNGGTGMTGAWATSGIQKLYTVAGSGLTFTGLSTEGNAAQRSDRSGGAEMNRGISVASQNALTADNSTIWFSVLMDTADSYPKGNQMAFLFSSDPISGPKDTPVSVSGGEAYGVGFEDTDPSKLHGLAVDDGTSSYSDDGISGIGRNEKFFIAGKINWAPNGSNDTLTVYNVTDPNLPLPSPFATMTDDLDQSQFDTLAIGDKQHGIVDEIRLGQSMEDVGLVPEPATMALLGLGGIGVLLRRRRA